MLNNIDETIQSELQPPLKKKTIKKTVKSSKQSKNSTDSTSSTTKVKNKYPPTIYNETQSKLKELSKILQCPIFAYFKPPNGNIWSEDLYAIMECLKLIGHVDTLAVYIRSDGGSGMVSLRIIHLLRSFVKNLILLAPSECASAATMLALGCDQIYMGPLSSLSPVDSSLTHPLSPVDPLNRKVSVSLDELSRVIKLWKEAENGDKHKSKTDIDNIKNEIEKDENPYKYLYSYIHPLVFGAVDRYSSLSMRICKEILSYHITDQEKINSITEKLNHDYPAHGYPITIREAEKMGLPVKLLDFEALRILSELQLLYGELSEDQITDHDRTSYHDNTIYSIIETENLQINYQHNFDKVYLENEKRYITMNDRSGWQKISKDEKGKIQKEKIFF
jgi:ATP-dependent protease ClpP protease subunit